MMARQPRHAQRGDWPPDARITALEGDADEAELAHEKLEIKIDAGLKQLENGQRRVFIALVGAAISTGTAAILFAIQIGASA